MRLCLKSFGLAFALLGLAACGGGGGGSSASENSYTASVISEDTVPLYRVLERSVTNNGPYVNKFTDVQLDVEYVSPSGRTIEFPGFYDGDGAGGQNGNVWKMRFMPDEAGAWHYTYTWSDGRPGGTGTFTAVAEGAGPGVLKAYSENPRWFAYNGSTPTFLKSYHVGAAGFTGTPIDWAAENVYGKLVSRGYNHVLLKALPIGWTNEKPADAPLDHVADPLWHDTPRVQNLSAWARFEEHMIWLAAHNVSVHFFMGFDPKGEDDSAGNLHFAQWRFNELSFDDQDAYVRYVAARLAPFANIAGWNYTWETDGNTAESRLMELLADYDPWKHLATYNDETPADNDYGNEGYSFAAIENHGYFGQIGGAVAIDSASHYQATIDAYREKPVYMVEGNGLWRACWAKENAETSITRAAWAVTLAGGSFVWQDAPECFNGPVEDMLEWPGTNPIADRLDVLYAVMTEHLVFDRMAPHPELLDGCWKDFDRYGPVPASPCYALAEPGSQYLVYKENGGEFRLTLAGGSYSATWIDTRNGTTQAAFGGAVSGNGSPMIFTTPNESTDWALMLRRRS